MLRKFEELSFAGDRRSHAPQRRRLPDAARQGADGPHTEDAVDLVTDPDLESRFARWVEHHVLHGAELDPSSMCDGRPDLVEPLAVLIADYRSVSDSLDGPSLLAPGPSPPDPPTLPAFEGFRTIECVGGGGMGAVYKLHDLKLDRIVAAKVLRGDRHLAARFAGFLTEARALALFQDRRIVQIHEFRGQATPPVLIMEYVDGFELGRLGPSLEFAQRARIMKEVCEAVQHAHRLGVQHRDLKPSNIMLDPELRPKILDFGLSSGNPTQGHFLGTPQYMAPEQLDDAQSIDARTDVYALGAILYELLCGLPPVDGADTSEVVARIRAGQVRLPVEIDPRVPEPLQAIALKALERQPGDRYPTAQALALDIGRYLDGRAVLTRPSQYASTLTTRVGPHLDQIEEWLRLKLVYPHEAARLIAAYRDLDKREDDWIGESRTLSYSQIALYLGAFLLMCGSLFYFGAHRIHDAVKGVAKPFVVLALPFVGLNLTAHFLERRDHRAVSVAFYLGGISLLPLFLLILFHETGLWVMPADAPGQLFPDAAVSNRQLQVTVLVACGWAAWLALRTRTIALSTVFTVLAFLLTLALLSDRGLRSWLENSNWDQLALHLLPLACVYGVLGFGLEKSGRPWFGRPLYTGSAVLLVVMLELLALDGRLFHHLGLSMQRFQASTVADPLLLDTMTTMSLNGIAFYLVASVANRHGTDPMKTAAWLLFTVAPFGILEPLAYLNGTAEVLRRVRLDLSGRRAVDDARQSPAAAQELLLCRAGQHGLRVLADRGPPSLVRPTVVGHGARDGRARRPGRRVWPGRPRATASAARDVASPHGITLPLSRRASTARRSSSRATAPASRRSPRRPRRWSRSSPRPRRLRPCPD